MCGHIAKWGVLGATRCNPVAIVEHVIFLRLVCFHGYILMPIIWSCYIIMLIELLCNFRVLGCKSCTNAGKMILILVL